MYKKLIVTLITVVSILTMSVPALTFDGADCCHSNDGLNAVFEELSRTRLTRANAIETISVALSEQVDACENVEALLNHFGGDFNMASEFILHIGEYVYALRADGLSNAEIEELLMPYFEDGILPMSIICVFLGHDLIISLTFLYEVCGNNFISCVRIEIRVGICDRNGCTFRTSPQRVYTLLSSCMWC